MKYIIIALICFIFATRISHADEIPEIYNNNHHIYRYFNIGDVNSKYPLPKNYDVETAYGIVTVLFGGNVALNIVAVILCPECVVFAGIMGVAAIGVYK
jgi:hypothetical protein